MALGVTPADVPERVARACAGLGLPTEIGCTPAEYAAAVGLDKKGAGEDISLILLEEIGRAVIHRMKKSQLLALLEE